MNWSFYLSTTLIVILLQVEGIAQSSFVKIWEEDLTLPTYVVDPPDKNPMFFKNDSYQGASKVIYPYPLEDDITNKKINKTYKAVYLENEYLKVCVLPEIGGRLFYATDKTNNYEIFYRQHVIKPAHIGMLGAWISGGIEFCVFHHHRATTNMPVDYKLVTNEDGSATLWIGETELRHRMKWTFGISLYPGKSYLELDGRLINSTENANSILYWANVATSVNDDYQVIFPPSTQFAVYHAKNSFSHWPITREAYRDNRYYENNIDASWWRNHPGPNSFFAHEVQEGFLAGYDHGKEAGTMLVGNPHIVKGAKLWEWGKGSVWDTKVLTDNDGPYAEVMSGAYSDNQPDYSWLKPYELKTFKQYWYPMRSSKGALTANLNGLLNLVPDSTSQQFYIAANTTSSYEDARILLEQKGKVLFEQQIDIAPSQPFNAFVKADDTKLQEGLRLSLFDARGKLLLAYVPVKLIEDTPLPDQVVPPSSPEEIESVEELYLTGLRIKQFYNARTNPMDYFEEALKRDSLDTRCNTQMGILYKEKGAYEKAAMYFRRALVRLTKNYTRPRNCEAFYHLGTILQAQGKHTAAYDTLYRAAWDHAFTAPAYFHLAQISCQRKDFDQALIELDRCLSNNGLHLNALNLKSTILRRLGKTKVSMECINRVLNADQLNFWAYNEKALTSNELADDDDQLSKLLRDNPESYLELAIAYLNAGLLKEAKGVLDRSLDSSNEQLSTYPTIHYYQGYIAHQQGKIQKAKEHFHNAQQLSTDYCFPFRIETISVYQMALSYNEADAKAHYYLGNLLYDKQPKKAIEHWEKSVILEPEMAIAHRNLGWGYHQAQNDLDKAILAYERAIASNNQEPRYFDELDRLYEQKGTPIQKRYQLLVDHHEVVVQHNRPLIREAMVAVAAQDYDWAIEILTTHYFNRKEGGKGLHDLYVDALLLRGKQYLQLKKWKLALADFKAADLYPENQSIGRDEESERRAQVFYYIGLATEKLGKKKEANSWYEQAIDIEVKEPEYHFQKALAYQKLGKEKEASLLFRLMEDKGRELLASTQSVDFFSKFGGSQIENKRKAAAKYLLGLSKLGTQNKQGAINSFEEATTLYPGHAWAIQMIRENKQGAHKE